MRIVTSRRPGVDLILLALTVVVAGEMIKASGPLLDRAFSHGIVTVAITALVTFLLPGPLMALDITRHAITGRMVSTAVGVLAILRLTLQGLIEAIAHDAELTGVRYALGLGTTAYSVAAVILVAAFVGGSAHGDVPTPSRWSPGIRVSLGITLGALCAAGLSLLWGTWDPFWRSGLMGWAPTAVLSVALIGCGFLMSHRRAVSQIPRHLWLIGPWIAVSVQISTNVAFISAQLGTPLSAVGISFAGAAMLPPALFAWYGGRFAQRHQVVIAGIAVSMTVAAMALLLFSPDPLDQPAAHQWLLLSATITLPALLSMTLAVSLNSGLRLVSWLPLTGAASAAGLGIIIPLLAYQIDYDIPLPLDNAWVPLAATMLLGLPGLWGMLRRRRPTATIQGSPETSVKSEAFLSRSARRVATTTQAPVRAICAVLGVCLALTLSGSLRERQSSTGVEVVDTSRIRVLNWNLHYGVSSQPGVQMAQIVQVIQDESPDLVMLQEVSRGWVLGGGVDMATYLAHATGMQMAFVPAADRQFGNVLLWNPDRGQMSDVARIALPRGAGPQDRSAISGTFTTDGVPIRVTSVHLQHREHNTPTRLDQLAALFAAEPVDGAYVLAGDFNAEPGWEEIGLIEGQGLTSAQDTVGDPDAATSPSVMPRYRIDWVFGSDLVTFEEARVLSSVVSDHRPIVVDLTIGSASSGNS